MHGRHDARGAALCPGTRRDVALQRVRWACALQGCVRACSWACMPRSGEHAGAAGGVAAARLGPARSGEVRGTSTPRFRPLQEGPAALLLITEPWAYSGGGRARTHIHLVPRNCAGQGGGAAAGGRAGHPAGQQRPQGLLRHRAALAQVPVPGKHTFLSPSGPRKQPQAHPQPAAACRGRPLQIQAERLLKLQQLVAQHAGRPVRPLRWVVMTSPFTHDETLEHFRQHRFFGLQEDQVRAARDSCAQRAAHIRGWAARACAGVRVRVRTLTLTPARACVPPPSADVQSSAFRVARSAARRSRSSSRAPCLASQSRVSGGPSHPAPQLCTHWGLVGMRSALHSAHQPLACWLWWPLAPCVQAR